MSTDQDPIEGARTDAWTTEGLDCAICPAGYALAGYVRLPQDLRHTWNLVGQVLTQDAPAITYGPDRFGWIGIDTCRAGDYWAPDDLIGRLPDAVFGYANQVREMVSRMPDGGRRWTIADLKATVNAVAQAVAHGALV